MTTYIQENASNVEIILKNFICIREFLLFIGSYDVYQDVQAEENFYLTKV